MALKRTFIDDQHLGPQPPPACLFVLLDLLRKDLGGFDAEADACEGVDRDAANVAGCYAWEGVNFGLGSGGGGKGRGKRTYQ